MNIQQIHEDVYSFLLKENEENGLRFSLRARNVSNRLDKGFWFSGNKDYLVVSFWEGLDWRNKTPNIFIYISSNGHLKLEFVSYDEENKIAFFETLADVLSMKRGVRKRTGDPYNHWYKNYQSPNYMDSLREFIKKDRKIIDAFIAGESIQSIFPPIDKVEFNRRKKRIEGIRKKRNAKQVFQENYDGVKSIELKTLEIKNISNFEGVHLLEFNKHITCLIGLNGTGKTSILRALVLAFTGYEVNEIMGIDDDILTNELSNMLRIEGVEDKKPRYAKDGYVQIDYELESSIENDIVEDANSYQNKVLFNSSSSRPQVSDDTNSDFKNIVDDKYLTLFLAFPQTKGDEVGEETEKYPNIEDAISMLNNKSDNRFSSFKKWIRVLTIAGNDNIKRGGSNDQEQLLLTKAFEIISAITTEKIRLHDVLLQEGTEDYDIWVTLGEDSPPILLDLISQGYNNIFGWIGYFIKRLVEVTPAGDNFLETPAIVLLDEIDTYLHPLWQINILPTLIDYFPNVQFIITTHSPYIVGSVPSEKINIYTCHKSNENDNYVGIEPFDEFLPYGADIDRLSEKIFGVKGRYVSAVADKLEELRSLIHDGDLTAAEDYLEQELKQLDENDPELMRNQRLIKMKKVLRK